MSQARPFLLNSAFWLCLSPSVAGSLLSCVGGEGRTGPAVSAPGAVSDAKARYYSNALPEAHSFVAHAIPRNLLKAANKGNDTYIEARNDQGHIIAYFRDFIGPVSTSASCACDPLNLTLVFNADRSFRDVIEVTPVHKWNNIPLTPQERALLIDIIKTPDSSLLEAASPDTLVDATSGATRKEYAPYVVEKAALVTQRLAKLAQDTQNILRRAPMKRDEQRLSALITQAPQSKDFLKRLALFIDDSESPELREQAFHELATRYPSVAEKKPDPKIEATLLRARVPRELRASACYLLAERGLRDQVTSSCSQQDGADPSNPIEAMLAGTVAYNKGTYALAIPDLENAAERVSHLQDPGLHYRLADAARRSNSKALACRVGKQLYRDAPLFPNADSLLSACSVRDGIDTLKAELELSRKQRVLNGEHVSTAQVPTLSLENAKGRPIESNLTSPDKLTLAVFFATWCPHCQKELPKLVRFQEHLNQNSGLAKKIRLLAVRTLIEREQEDYSAFKQRFAINFPIYSDPAMGIGLSSFARSQGIEQPGVPLMALIDTTGDVRYLLRSHEFSDTRKEIEWLVEALAAETSK